MRLAVEGTTYRIRLTKNTRTSAFIYSGHSKPGTGSPDFSAVCWMIESVVRRAHVSVASNSPRGEIA